MHFAYTCQWGCWLLFKHMCVLSLVTLGRFFHALPIPQAQLWCLSLQLSKKCPSILLLWCWFIVSIYIYQICFLFPCWHWGFFVTTVQCPGMCVSHLEHMSKQLTMLGGYSCHNCTCLQVTHPCVYTGVKWFVARQSSHALWSWPAQVRHAISVYKHQLVQNSRQLPSEVWPSSLCVIDQFWLHVCKQLMHIICRILDHFDAISCHWTYTSISI